MTVRLPVLLRNLFLFGVCLAGNVHAHRSHDWFEHQGALAPRPDMAQSVRELSHGVPVLAEGCSAEGYPVRWLAYVFVKMDVPKDLPSSDQVVQRLGRDPDYFLNLATLTVKQVLSSHEGSWVRARGQELREDSAATHPNALSQESMQAYFSALDRDLAGTRAHLDASGSSIEMKDVSVGHEPQAACTPTHVTTAVQAH